MDTEEMQMEWSSAELEDGELSDPGPSPQHKFSFDKDGKGATKHSAFDEKDLKLMESRANRFGFNNKSGKFDDELHQLYKSLSINTEEDIRHTEFDTVHIYGTEKMTTNDIFEYFFTHTPLFLEWIDENSCNVVWKDNISAARAMVFYSNSISYENDPSQDLCIHSDHCIAMDAINAEDIPVTIPPGKWRIGAKHSKSEYIFLRFGNKSDKKLTEDEKLKLYSKKYDESIGKNEVNSKISESLKSKIKSADSIILKKDGKNKNPWGDLCKSWGINDSQEKNISLPHIEPINRPSKSVKERIGLPFSAALSDRINPADTESYTEPKSSNLKMRLGKRGHEQISQISSGSESDSERSSDEDWKIKSKVPRMRMHADDEEDKMAKQRFTDKSHAWKASSINKITVEIENESSHIGDADSSIENSTIQKKNYNKDFKSNIHSRLGARRESSDDDSDYYVKNKGTVKNSVDPKNKKYSKTTVWSRLDVSKKKAVVETESDSDCSEKDLRRTLSSSKSKKVNPTKVKQDLRKRLTKKKDQKSTLRIEFDNELYSDSN